MPFEMDSTISIHAPREGGDLIMRQAAIDAGEFQSTPPARGATHPKRISGLCQAISIHAPREGGDCGHCDRLAGHQYFNPRPPRGGRRRERQGEK